MARRAAGSKQAMRQRLRNRAGYIVLEIQDVREVAAIGLRPQCEAFSGVQLGFDTNPWAFDAYTAVQHETDIESLCDCLDVRTLSFERKRRSSRRHAQSGCMRQLGNKFSRNAVAEIAVRLVIAHAGKR